MNDEEYDNYLGDKYKVLEDKLKMIESARKKKVEIDMPMIKKACFIVRLKYSEINKEDQKVEVETSQQQDDEGEQQEEDEEKEEIQDDQEQPQEGEEENEENPNEDKVIEPEQNEAVSEDQIDAPSPQQNQNLNTGDTVTFLDSEPTKDDYFNLKFMHLEFRDITDIANLTIFLNLETLYLQYNRITEIKGLENLVNLQYLALQNNLIKEIKNLSHLSKLAYLNLSYNKIKEFDATEIPKNLLMLKIMDNPCEKTMADYRKSVVLHCEILEEMDNVAVHVAERMHYQGLIEINLEEQLSAIKDRIIEKELKSRLEDELMEE